MAVLGKAPVSGGQLPTISFMTSQTWTPAYDLTAYVYVIGAGGSGGATNNSVGGACGGGAGGCAVSKLDLSASTTYTVTIGVGGDRAYAENQATNGAAGGNTSFSGSDISTMTGNGGSGGVTRASNDTTTATGAAGGTATGGNLGNFTGGKGAAITSSVNNVAYIMGGGGAVGLWSTGQDAPDALSAYGYTTRGGMLNIEKNDLNAGKWYNRASNQNAGDHHENGYPTIEAFQGITTQLITVTAPNTSATDYDRNHTIRTGTINSKGSAHVQDSKVWGIQSAPFEGGSGQGVAVGYGARGCAGSGGGGSYAYSAATQSGGGGMGLVLIFPISMGA